MVAMNFRMIDKVHGLKITWQVIVYILTEQFQMLYFVNVFYLKKNFFKNRFSMGIVLTSSEIALIQGGDLASHGR